MAENPKTPEPANKKLRGEEAEGMQVEVAVEGYAPYVPMIQIPDPATGTYKQLPAIDEDGPEWTYSMRRTMQEILPGLYLGPYAVASKDKLQSLKEAGITHILCVRHVIEKSVIRPNFPNDFIYLVMDIADDHETLLIPFLRKAHGFIDEALNNGGKVLVHGNAGISRSSSIVIAYVMAVYGVSYCKALRFVQSKRLTASPSEWFAFQLQEYQVFYQAFHDEPVPLPELGQETPASRPQLKRVYIEEDDDNINFN